MKSSAKIPSDKKLMLAYRDGDEAAFVLLFKRYELKVFNFFLRHMGDRARAEDLLQETFLKLHRCRKSYEPSASFSTWIFTIATNLLRDWMLSAKRQACVIKLENEVRDRALVWGSPSESMGTWKEKSPEDEYGAKEMAYYLRQAVQSLPSDQRKVILLAKYEGFKYQEVAEILSITVGAVKVRAHRAIKTLEEILTYQLGRPSL